MNRPHRQTFNALQLGNLIGLEKCRERCDGRKGIRLLDGGNGAVGQVRNTSTGASIVLTSSAPTTKCLGLTFGGTGFTVGQTYDFNWEAESEL